MQADTAMPTQSAPQAFPTQPTSYAAPVAQTAAQAPAVATTSQWVAPYQQAVAPAPQMQAQMGVQNYQSAPTQYSPQAFQAPQQAENPYKEAFNRVVGLLSSPVQFPFQGQQSTANQQIAPVNYDSQQIPQFNNAGMPTSMPGINNNQAYSNASSQTSREISRDQLLANGVSEASLQVVDYFGADAPAILNNYACQVEDALIQTNQQLIEAVNLLQELSNEHKAYETILTDPDVLADYTCEFFGENGPYPISDEEIGYAPAQQQMQAVGQQFQRPVAPQRPEMPLPPQPQAQGNPGDFWNSFGTLADRDPANAWRYLNAAQSNPEVFRQKLLVME
jgi:hypothetical protein